MFIWILKGIEYKVSVLQVFTRANQQISDGFANLSKLSSLRVLDLQKNSIDIPFAQIPALLIKPLKFLPKLQYLSLEANPVESSITNFRYYIIHEIPKLEYYNYVRITKEVRTFFVLLFTGLTRCRIA